MLSGLLGPDGIEVWDVPPMDPAKDRLEAQVNPVAKVVCLRLTRHLQLPVYIPVPFAVLKTFAGQMLLADAAADGVSSSSHPVGPTRGLAS